MEKEVLATSLPGEGVGERETPWRLHTLTGMAHSLGEGRGCCVLAHRVQLPLTLGRPMYQQATLGNP